MTVTTLAERKSAEAARRGHATDTAVARLRSYASSHGGRFVVFGSCVTGRMRYDSDFDVMVDFPAATSADAWRFAEELCTELRVPLDIHDAATTKPEFVRRVRESGLVLE